MKEHLTNTFLILAFAIVVLTGCNFKDFPGKSQTNSSTKSETKSRFPATDEGAKSLLKEFAKPGADYAALSKQLRPTKADYEAFFKPDLAVKATSVYDPAWDAGQMIISPNEPARTEVIIQSSTSEDIIKWTGTAAKEFPGGWKKVAPHLKPGLKIYEFSFVEPGKTSGMRYDGLVNINGNWRIFPKPWRLVE